jgi:predicted RNase H-like HicB family nuclease
MQVKGKATINLCYYFIKRFLKMLREVSVIIEKDEDGYFVASVLSLRGCHTQAKSLDVLMKRIKEAIELCREVEDPYTPNDITYKLLPDTTVLKC